MIGTVLGQYRITGSIGSGGMGVVYAGEHVLLHRPAAIKVLLPELSQNQENVKRFFNEARAATSIRHPSIVEIYDFGFHTDGSAFIAMEYLQGESLAARTKRGRMAIPSMLSIVRQLAGALSAAHAKGIVHRDLKPDNVFLVPDPEVPGGERIKLLDFGIAKIAAEQGHGQTRTGAVMGTPTYMAPEQCRGIAVDHRADLYSIGCILFEMCVGHPPFVGEGVGDVLAAHIHVPPPLMGSLTRDIPSDVEGLVQRLLVKDPAQRIQSAQELLHSIDVIVGMSSYGGRAVSSPVGTYPPSVATASLPTTLSGAPRSITVPPQGRSRTPWFVGLGVVAVVGTVIAIAMNRGDGSAAKVVAVAPESPASKPLPAPTPAPAPVPPHPVAPAPLPPPPPPPATIDVVIDSTPSKAEVLLDGVTLGKTPFHGTLPNKDASTTFVVKLSGYLDGRVTERTDHAITQTVVLQKKTARPARPAANTRDDSVNPFGN